MRECDIRPPNLTAELNRVTQEDVRRLLQYRDGFVAVDCPACGSSTGSLQFEKAGFDFQECNDCGTLFISPRPTAKMLAEYYATSESMKFWNRRIFPASESVRKDQIFRPRVSFVAQSLGKKPVGTIVDVGAGFGWFAALCLEEGLARRVVAVEPNPELAESCRNFPGVEVIEGPIETCYETLHADVITCFELIEHIFEPGDFLCACYRGCLPGGVFICTTPNWKGFDLAILRDRSDNVMGPNHLQLFNSFSLLKMLRHVGFVDIVISTPGALDVDILRNKMLNEIVNPSIMNFFGTVIRDGSEELRQDLQLLLQRHGLSSNMMAVARKPKV
jgi:2-polyprenyl-3-methyl-5-hydroxy-6-metoxy-1,4-benzoquinol methylase